MPACPNCGRPTLRTRDWACQWCGYPLLSRAYKKIDKTFKELQEERFPSLKAAPENKPPPVPENKPPPVPAPAPAPEVPLQPESELESGPVPPVTLTAPEPAPELAPEPEPLPLPEPPPKPEPPPVAMPDLDAVTDGAVLSVDELDALYKADRQAAHAKLSGKTIAVKGFVEKVFIRDHIDVRYIVLTGASRKVVWPVRCTFDKQNISRMERLAEGQEVALRGKYDSYGKNIIFKDCSLV
jgi:hypothetical protein